MPKSEIVIEIGKDGPKSARQVNRHVTNGAGANNQNGAAQPEVRTFKSMTWGERLRFLREFITVEPLLVCFVFASTLVGPAFKNLLLQKSCLVDSEFDDMICDAILSGNNANITQEVATVHLHIANAQSWLVPINSFVPLVLSLFWGSFSDRHQIRKPFLLLPLFGELISIVGCILSTILLRQWSMTTFLAIAYLASSVLGGQTLLVVVLFAYVADISTVEQRTLRIGVCQTVMLIAQIAANALSGVLFLLIGYYGVFSACFIIMLLGFMYGLFCITDKLRPKEEKRRCLLFDLFDPTLIVETIKVITVKKVGNNRLYIILFMIIFFIYNGVSAGEDSIFLLYLNGSLGFTVVEYSYLLTFVTLIFLKGNIIGTYLFTKVLNLSDYVIILISFTGKILANIVMALAVNAIMIYIGAYIELFNNLSIIALRSLATKVVRQEDLGKAQSFFGVFETLGGAVFVPVYNQLIFANTQISFPSAFLFAAILFLGICILIIISMQMRERQIKSRTPMKNEVRKGIDNEGLDMTETEISHM